MPSCRWSSLRNATRFSANNCTGDTGVRDHIMPLCHLTGDMGAGLRLSCGLEDLLYVQLASAGDRRGC